MGARRARLALLVHCDHPMLRGARILVADDDADMRDTVGAVLQRAGAEVVPAESGAELIEKVADEGPFSVIVTDVAMPWMSGLQVMHSARTLGLATPVIVITGLRDEGIAGHVHALGHRAALLRKPFELDALVSLCARMLTARAS